jgi:hypothetical protein
VLVDTGMIDSRPEIDDLSPMPHPDNIPPDVACVFNTHLHFDHCGGNRLFPGVPIHVQAPSSPTPVRSTTTRSVNGSTSTARRMSNTRARWSCYRESACCRRPGTRTGGNGSTRYYARSFGKAQRDEARARMLEHGFGAVDADDTAAADTAKVR